MVNLPILGIIPFSQASFQDTMVCFLVTLPGNDLFLPGVSGWIQNPNMGTSLGCTGTVFFFRS